MSIVNHSDMKPKAVTTGSQNEMEQFISTVPMTSPCQRHPDISQQRDDRRSWLHRAPKYQRCRVCADEENKALEIARLQKMGVPAILLEATLENWGKRSEQHQVHRDKVAEFIRVKRGFLIMLGELGTGKSHLAVACLRHFKHGWFVKQSELLRHQRNTYNDKCAFDPVEKAQNAGCLVLDEMGLSSGGKDEFMLLHDILDHRYGNQKPTILTGNLAYETLTTIIGERMADRLQEAHFAVLSFGGESHRNKVHNKYFKT